VISDRLKNEIKAKQKRYKSKIKIRQKRKYEPPKKAKGHAWVIYGSWDQNERFATKKGFRNTTKSFNILVGMK